MTSRSIESPRSKGDMTLQHIRGNGISQRIGANHKCVQERQMLGYKRISQHVKITTNVEQKKGIISQRLRFSCFIVVAFK
jgi:hypothetical protein